MQTRLPNGYHRCLGSGLCCKTRPCAFGTWDAAKHQCAHLEVDQTSPGATIYRCGIHDEIAKQPGSEWNPAFGAGCCMPLFNDLREAIIAAGVEPSWAPAASDEIR